MKTITIRLPDVEATMFSELRTDGAEMKMLLMLISSCIRERYVKRKDANRR